MLFKVIVGENAIVKIQVKNAWLGLPDNEHEINLHNKYLGNNPRHQQFILSSIDVINGKMLYMRHPCYIKGL